MNLKTYIERALIAFDIFMNVVFDGDEDETISTRSGRARDEGKRWGKVLAGVLDWLVTNHVENAKRHDVERAEALLKIDENQDKRTA